MFTIDLLKGQGIPERTRPVDIAATAVILTIPLLVGIILFGGYVRTKVDTSVQKQRIVSYEREIAKLSDAVSLQESFEKEKNAINCSLSEVASSIGTRVQWSPILVAVAENMPDSMVLTSLEVKERSVKKRVPKKDNPEKQINITVSAKTLSMNLSGSREYNCDKAVREFSDRLRLGSVLGPKLGDIRVSQQFGTLEGRDAVSYEIDCIFKPPL